MAQSRIEVSYDGQSIIATLNMVSGDLLGPDEAALSEAAWNRLGARSGDFVRLSHAPPVESMSHVRTKAYGGHVDAAGINEVVRDIAAGRFSDIELAAFVTADRARRLSLERVDGEPVVGSPWEPLLIEMGFRAGPRKLTLSA